jgi:hypothetical protein
MSRPFTTIAGLLLIAAGAAHAVRAICQWPVTVDTVTITVWASYVAAIVPAFLGVMVLRGR